jgi:integrase
VNGTGQAAINSRRRGAGSIRERSPGHYELRAYNPVTRKQVTRTFHAPRPEKGSGIRAARAELAKLVAEVAEGNHDRDGQKATVAELLDDWLSQRRAVGRSPTTLHDYAASAGRIKASAIGTKTVARLTTRDIDVVYSSWRVEGMTPATVLHHHRVLRAALNQAERWGWISRNPAKAATVASSRPPELQVPTTDHAQALVTKAASTGSPDLAPILVFAMLTGCRRGEICGLQWGDIDWTTQRMTVRRSVWQVRRSWGIKGTKTHQVRRIALDENAVALLAARRATADADARAAGSLLVEEAFVWSPTVDASVPRTPSSLTRAFARLCASLEAEARLAGRNERFGFRFHDLRHFSATELIGAGVDIRTVAGRLGHADPAITLRVYAHALEERDRAAAQLLGRRLTLSIGQRADPSVGRRQQH